MSRNRPLSRRRQFKAGVRDLRLLLREFQKPLFFFLLAVFGCGMIYYYLARQAGEAPDSLVESVYFILTLIFLQGFLDFPHAWYLQAFHFIMPVIGIGLLAQGLTDFGVMLFNRRARGKDWEMAVASTFSNHVVLIGLGHLGFRVVQQLSLIEQDVVVVQYPARPDLELKVREMGIPVIEDDGSKTEAQLAAGIPSARAVILCTQNDSLNLQMALKARSLNPSIQVIIRIFDDDFAHSLQEQFGFRAFSATGMAAPIFAASAANVDITPTISIEGEPNCLARLQVQPQSSLKGQSISAVEEFFDLSIVFHGRDGNRDLHPASSIMIQQGDTLAVLGRPEKVSTIVHANEG